MSSPWLSGIIEGFYGRQWSWQQREDWAEIIQQCQLSTYIYAPKGDSFLRKQWALPWPQAEFTALQKLASHYRRSGLQWGIGLSPFALYQQFDSTAQRQLADKLALINQLQPAVLCLLFDDMPGDCPDLARRQLAICDFVAAASNAQRLIVCPTYYSNDPVLERFFGPRPSQYWQQLGQGLDPAIDLFWTGEQVCSESYSFEALQAIADLWRRKPVLWDNYPVNDGAKACQFLHLSAKARPQQLQDYTNGWLINPMNQPSLSQLAVRAMAAQMIGQVQADRATLAQQLLPQPAAQCLLRDWNLFEQSGLTGMDAAQRAELLACYQQWPQPAAVEIAAWLSGEYAFDPACLTG